MKVYVINSTAGIHAPSFVHNCAIMHLQGDTVRARSYLTGLLPALPLTAIEAILDGKYRRYHNYVEVIV